MQAHYVCTGGCGAQVNEPGICEDEKCLMYNMDFDKCGCKDSQHDEVLKASPDDLDEEGWGADDLELDQDEVAKWDKKFGSDTSDDKLYN